VSLLGDLTPAQAIVLVEGGALRGARVLKVGLLGLIGRRAVQTGRRPSWPWSGPGETELSCSPTFAGPLRDDETALLTIIDRMPSEALTLSAFLRTARDEYGTRFRGFRDEVVVPQLVQAGLVERRQERLFFGIIPRTRLVQTPSGAREAARIEGGLEALRRVPELLRSNRAEAVALVAAAGGATLLVRELEPLFAELRQAMDDSGYVGLSSDFSFENWRLDSDVVDVSSDFDASCGDGGGGDGGGGDGGGD
jgi:hypothetical protein